MAKWVDARDLKSLSGYPNAGSSPAPSTDRSTFARECSLTNRPLFPALRLIPGCPSKRGRDLGQLSSRTTRLRHGRNCAAVLAVPAVPVQKDQMEDGVRPPTLAHFPQFCHGRIRTAVEPRV